MARLFIFGLGYSAKRIKHSLERIGWTVAATGSDGEVPFDEDEAVLMALGRSTHVLSSIPPDGESDPVLTRYGDALSHRWLGYLSSTGVYGDTGGAWVDESACTGRGRRGGRAGCDAQWLARGARVFRLPGIYGPGRSAIERVRAGAAHRLDLPGQVFSRIHVEDLAAGVIAALEVQPGAYNLADDLPASQNAVIEEACQLLDREPPPLQSLDEAGLSPPARAFYSENRRVANGRAKRVLGWSPRFPDYRAGLRDCLKRSSP